MPLVTIVMRSKNDILYIAETFEKILKQKFTDFEILNFDSGSEDGTWEIIQKYNPDKSWQIRPGDYVPGKVLNNAVNKAKGEIIVFNNSDCIPEDENWLGRLIEPLLSPDADKIYGVFCNQLARPDAFPLVRKDNMRAFGDGSVAATWNHFFSLASSAIFKKILLEHPFREDLQYSEDADWAWQMKKLNYKASYAADAKVEHSHNYSLKELKKRFYNEGIAEGQIYAGKKTFCGFVFSCLAEIGRDIIYLLKTGKILVLPSALVYRITQRLYSWKGRHDYLAGGKAGNE
ncbi:MAG: glycosyltransferase family 2 protein [Victivallaceae bacterium]|nr:glycosyltransferase family 2 protein [Victivallaceae bacterium]